MERRTAPGNQPGRFHGRTLRRVVRSRPVQRLVRSLLVGFGVMCVSFGLIRFIPGDPVALMLGDMATPENIANMRMALGLNGTVPEQFLSYAGHLLQGDLGTSIATRQSVNA